MRRTLILAMALPGLSPFGQTFAQFMIWWHLHVKASRGFSTLRAAFRNSV